eukprot:Nk52_evm2s2391 gene=Nk52_evmTU2s2391
MAQPTSGKGKRSSSSSSATLPAFSFSTGDSQIDSAVSEWLRLDRDPATRKETLSMIKEAKKEDCLDDLKAAFLHRMKFGTAGLRAAMGAGVGRMNNLTVIQATQGFAQYLEQVLGKDKLCDSPGVVIGHDARHHSRMFALHAAQVFISRGVKVHLYRQYVPTPFVPFRVKTHHCVAGIMVTASHNPKEDNGYKVYWGNAAQIIPPHDSGIAACIEELASTMDNSHVWLLNEQTKNDEDPDVLRNALKRIAQSEHLYEDPLDEVMKSYYDVMVKHLHFNSDQHNGGSGDSIRFVYTPMHGVGLDYAKEAFHRVNLPPFDPVPAQQDPDPEFTTVRFPNPEEGKSALNLAMAEAASCGASVIVANDPDADRLAVAELQPSSNDGKKKKRWHVFTGNEIAIILASWLWKNYQQKGASGAVGEKRRGLMVASTVSSKFLDAMGKAEGFDFVDCLTGFKWIANTAMDRVEQGTHDCIFAYEEAIGFMCGLAVPDKDGISACATIAECAVDLYNPKDSSQKKTTLYEHLRDCQRRYGYFASNNSYFFCYDKAVIKRIFARLRGNGGSKEGRLRGYLSSCGEYKVKDIRDLTTPGFDSKNTKDGAPFLPVQDASSEMITYYFENGCVCTLRTSGTEPKIKYYTEMSGKYTCEEDIGKIQAVLDVQVKAIIEEFLQPEKNGLKPRKA